MKAIQDVIRLEQARLASHGKEVMETTINKGNLLFWKNNEESFSGHEQSTEGQF